MKTEKYFVPFFLVTIIVVSITVAACDECERKEITDGEQYIVGTFSHVEYDEAGYWYDGKTFIYLEDGRVVILKRHKTIPVKKGETIRFDNSFGPSPCDKWGTPLWW